MLIASLKTNIILILVIEKTVPLRSNVICQKNEQVENHEHMLALVINSKVTFKNIDKYVNKVTFIIKLVKN